MEIDTAANIVMTKEKTDKPPRSPRRATVKRKPPRKPHEAGESALVASPDGVPPSLAGETGPIPPAPVARAKRTRSTAKKARASGKATQLVSAKITPPEATDIAAEFDAPAAEKPGDRAGHASTSVLQDPAESANQAERNLQKRTRRGRRRRREGKEELTPSDQKKAPAIEKLVEDVDQSDELTTPTADVKAVGNRPASPHSPDEATTQKPHRERRRRRGRRGRGQGASEAPAHEPAFRGRNAAATAAPALVPDGDVDFDDELPLDDEPFMGGSGVELEGADDLDISDEESTPAVSGSRQMMINVSAGTECRIAILQDNRLEEFFIERDSTQSHVGNIYKGKVTNVEPSIQAAFVDFGLEKNGFLHISDVQPQYFPNHTGEPEDVGRKIPRHLRPPIQRCFRRGQEVIVQITKEGVGTKGPTLTSYLSIPGRFLVMMPGMSRHGVSRKIEDEAQRREMRDLMAKLELPTGMGFIMRTAGLGRNPRELQRDLNYLVRLWKTVVDRIKKMATPAELYRESDLVTRTIRDIYTADFDRIVIDDATVAKKVGEFLQIAVPRSKTVVEHYADREPLFHRFGIEAELERINMRHVPLRSGGSLVIDSTEAMVAIDVNSGRFRTPADAEETALQINIEAAEEIARQLRLRDLGGLIVCDFIDMRHDRNKRRVENALRDALKKHKERARILRMSAFGLIEMTRQRQGPSLHRNLYTDCPECRGTGHVKLAESVTLDAMRMIQFAAHHEQVQRIVLSLSRDVAFRLLNLNRGFISQVESETNKSIVIHGNDAFTSDQMEIACEDSRGRPVTISAVPSPQNNGRAPAKV